MHQIRSDLVLVALLPPTHPLLLAQVHVDVLFLPLLLQRLLALVQLLQGVRVAVLGERLVV